MIAPGVQGGRTTAPSPVWLLRLFRRERGRGFDDGGHADFDGALAHWVAREDFGLGRCLTD